MKKRQISTQGRLKSLGGALLLATCCGVGATLCSSGDASAAVRQPSVTITVGNVSCNGDQSTCTELTPGKVGDDGSSQSSFRASVDCLTGCFDLHYRGKRGNS